MALIDEVVEEYNAIDNQSEEGRDESYNKINDSIYVAHRMVLDNQDEITPEFKEEIKLKEIVENYKVARQRLITSRNRAVEYISINRNEVEDDEISQRLWTIYKVNKKIQTLLSNLMVLVNSIKEQEGETTVISEIEIKELSGVVASNLIVSKISNDLGIVIGEEVDVVDDLVSSYLKIQ